MRFGTTLTSALFLACAACAPALGDVVIHPRETGQLINRFFYDFKSPSAPRKFTQGDWAKTLLVDYGFTGIRTSIYGTGKKPAHPKPGVVLEKLYEPETKGLKLAEKINPRLIIFASKKLDNKDSFPDWTKDRNGIVPERYAILLADYLQYMKREGLVVDVLGIDNERRFNEGNITPKRHRDIVLELRKLTAERDLQMPKIIGHEDYEMGRDQWIVQTKESMKCVIGSRIAAWHNGTHWGREARRAFRSVYATAACTSDGAPTAVLPHCRGDLPNWRRNSRLN